MIPLKHLVPIVLAAGTAMAVVIGLPALLDEDRPAPSVPSPVDSALVAEQAHGALLDSLRAATHAADDSLHALAAEQARQVTTLARAATNAAREAQTLATLAVARGDTLSAAWGAYLWADRRADSLDVALVVSEAARAVAEARTERWKGLADSTELRRRAVIGVAVELRQVAERALHEQAKAAGKRWSVGATAGPGCTIAVSGSGQFPGACGLTLAIGVTRRFR